MADEPLDLDLVRAFYVVHADRVDWTYDSPLDVLYYVPALVDEVAAARRGKSGSDMRIIDASAGEPHIDAGGSCPDSAGWDLTNECKISYGRDGDGGPWIVYLGLTEGADLYVKATRDQLAEHAWNILYALGPGDLRKPAWFRP